MLLVADECGSTEEDNSTESSEASGDEEERGQWKRYEQLEVAQRISEGRRSEHAKTRGKRWSVKMQLLFLHEAAQRGERVEGGIGRTGEAERTRCGIGCVSSGKRGAKV